MLAKYLGFLSHHSESFLDLKSWYSYMIYSPLKNVKIDKGIYKWEKVAQNKNEKKLPGFSYSANFEVFHSR